jgi:hypothetical protein
MCDVVGGAGNCWDFPCVSSRNYPKTPQIFYPHPITIPTILQFCKKVTTEKDIKFTM